jgi:hypothetical protein
MTSNVSPNWQPDIPISGSHSLPPDPHIVDSIGRNHQLETAVADLIDNSLDAGASMVLIRFVTNDDRVSSLYVVDDGRGIPADGIDSAMKLGGVREYQKSDLGHFGLGLKAASFSQAASLTLISHAKGSTPVGRRWLEGRATNSFTVDVVDPAFCAHELGLAWPISGGVRTIVRWDELHDVPPGGNAEATRRFTYDAVSRLQHHLGLIFHRIIDDFGIGIGIDVQDAASGDSGPLMKVEAIDPFGYARSGVVGYPKTVSTDIDGVPLAAVCHVWPGRSQLQQFRLPGRSPERCQGFYFYRRNRLIQAGGWNGLEVERRDLQLARVAVDMDDELVESGVYRLNPEKTRVETTEQIFSRAMHVAHAPDGATLESFLGAAENAYRQANQRRRERAPVAPLGKGFAPKLRKAFESELRALPGYADVDLRWDSFDDDTFFTVDRDNSVIRLNDRYRRVLNGGDRTRASLNDAPLVKALMFLLVENLFHGSHFGPKDKDNMELWQILLTAAAREELS